VLKFPFLPPPPPESGDFFTWYVDEIALLSLLFSSKILIFALLFKNVEPYFALLLPYFFTEGHWSACKDERKPLYLFMRFSQFTHTIKTTHHIASYSINNIDNYFYTLIKTFGIFVECWRSRVTKIFHCSKNINKQWNISLFHRKALKKCFYLFLKSYVKVS